MVIVMSTRVNTINFGAIAFLSLSLFSACNQNDTIQTVTADPVIQSVSFAASDHRALMSSSQYYHTNLVLVDESSQCPFPQSEDETQCIRSNIPTEFTCTYTGVVGCWGNSSKYICMFDCVELKDVEVINASN